jgi:hypothetical protein
LTTRRIQTFFWFSISFLITASGAPSTVETKQLLSKASQGCDNRSELCHLVRQGPIRERRVVGGCAWPDAGRGFVDLCDVHAVVGHQAWPVVTGRGGSCGRRRGRQRRACAHCRMPTRCGLRTQTGAARKLKIAQPPTKLDFGSTFVALLDPDGHHLRVFAPPVP